ncbi:hypothetical protein HPB50_000383 [Hyalomma asiaticum]|uniref:Uncharacterized protein n=1 Tax=Hyalomma asiaticum TaxID=266040 RepID=A0ACB7SAZ5_HYAAI|nr:hypothetical protein HPB50_000383 [Hyalomma asiaticum]
MSVQEVLPVVPDHDGSSHIIMAQAPGIMMSARCQNNVDRKARSAKTRILTDTMDLSEHQGQVTQVLEKRPCRLYYVLALGSLSSAGKAFSGFHAHCMVLRCRPLKARGAAAATRRRFVAVVRLELARAHQSVVVLGGGGAFDKELPVGVVGRPTRPP